MFRLYSSTRLYTKINNNYKLMKIVKMLAKLYVTFSWQWCNAMSIGVWILGLLFVLLQLPDCSQVPPSHDGLLGASFLLTVDTRQVGVEEMFGCVSTLCDPQFLQHNVPGDHTIIPNQNCISSSNFNHCQPGKCVFWAPHPYQVVDGFIYILRFAMQALLEQGFGAEVFKDPLYDLQNGCWNGFSVVIFFPFCLCIVVLAPGFLTLICCWAKCVVRFLIC
jgi:hypothetical protein